jgi:hypothetical protein
MMKPLLYAFVALLVQLTSAAATAKRSPKVVSIDISRKPLSSFSDNNDLQHVLRKRSTVSLMVSPNSEYYVYLASLSFGTPPQAVTLVVDATVGDTWVNVPTNAWCRNVTNGCSQWGMYDYTKSSTVEFVRHGFNITYGDDTMAAGDYVSDTVDFGGVTLQNTEFALGTQSNSTTGVLGLGYPVQEQQVTDEHKQPYPNILQAMANAGVINTDAYSIWLTDPSSTTNGTMLFGGVDRDKYSGELRTVEIVSSASNQSQTLVPLTGLTMGKEDFLNGTNNNISVIIDMGTSLTMLPHNITNRLFAAVGAVTGENGTYIPCSQLNNQTTLNFTLSWPQVNLTIGEFVIPHEQGDPPDMCSFGIEPADDQFILGQTFIRGAYLVLNLGYNEISLARTRFNVTTSDIVEITSGLDGVPGAIRAPLQTSRPATHSSLSSGAKAGISVGVLLGALLAGISVIFLLMRRRTQNRRNSEATAAASESLMSPRSGVTATDESADEYRKVELHGDSIYRPVELENADDDRKEMAGRKFSDARVELPDRKYSGVAFELPDRKFSVAELPGDGPESLVPVDRKDTIESPMEETPIEERRDPEKREQS